MLYVAYGNDFQSRKKYIDSVYETMHSKRPDAQVIICDKEQFSKQLIQQYTTSIGLFDEKSIIKLLGICEEKEHKDVIFDNISELIESDNAFLLSEEKLGVTDLNKLKKQNVHLKEFTLTEKKVVFSLFVLGDLLLQKNKQKLLLSIYTNINQGVSIEEIVGILVWQIKSLALTVSFNQSQSGLKPYVYNKCLGSNWKKEEVLGLYKKTITQYHLSRRGGLNSQERLELILLEI